MQKPPAFALCPIRSGSIPCNVRRAESCVGLLVHRPTTNEGGYLDKDTKYDTTAVRVGVDMLDTAVMDSACWTRRGVLVIASDPPTRRPKNAHACIHSRPAASSTHPPPRSNNSCPPLQQNTRAPGNENKISFETFLKRVPAELGFAHGWKATTEKAALPRNSAAESKNSSPLLLPFPPPHGMLGRRVMIAIESHEALACQVFVGATVQHVPFSVLVLLVVFGIPLLLVQLVLDLRV